MQNEVIILVADDDRGHLRLIEKNLERAGLRNRIEVFQDGEDLLAFLRGGDATRLPHPNHAYLLLLDIHMPRLDGVEVLREMKLDPQLRRIPVCMLSTTDDPREVDRCHAIGCSNYIVKPVDYEKFANAIRQLGLFLSLIQVPELGCVQLGSSSPNASA